MISGSIDRVITAVRVRPLNENEINRGNQVIVVIDGKEEGSVVVVDPIFYQKQGVDRKTYERKFNYDFSFWSASPQENFSTQVDVFQKCGAPLIEHCLNGLNSSILAFGVSL